MIHDHAMQLLLLLPNSRPKEDVVFHCGMMHEMAFFAVAQEACWPWHPRDPNGNFFQIEVVSAAYHRWSEEVEVVEVVGETGVEVVMESATNRSFSFQLCGHRRRQRSKTHRNLRQHQAMRQHWLMWWCEEHLRRFRP